MLSQWVGDRLHDILGISDKHIAEYFVALASKSSSAENFVDRLRKTGTVDVDLPLTNFAGELYNKVTIATINIINGAINQLYLQIFLQLSLNDLTFC